MDYSNIYGVSVVEKNWVPAPSYVLRRSRILNLFKKLDKGKGIEFGCGSGSIIYDLNRMGFEIYGSEFSVEAFSLSQYVNKNSLNIIFGEPNIKLKSSMDYIMAFEVLEHVDDHVGVLKEWVSYLKPDGKIVISVPAHPRKWNESDLWAGHFRRYKKNDLFHLVDAVGFEVVKVENYGYPLQNLMRPIRAKVHKKIVSNNNKLDNISSSKRSGTERSAEMKMWKFQNSIFGRVLMYVCIKLQSLFINTNLGNGYLVLCRRKL